MIATYAIHHRIVGQIVAEITFGDDGSLTIATERKVKGMTVLSLPRRIESAQERVEALTR